MMDQQTKVEEHVNEWAEAQNAWAVEAKKRISIYPNKVSQTGARGRWAVAVDNSFEDAFVLKKDAENYRDKRAIEIGRRMGKASTTHVEASVVDPFRTFSVGSTLPCESFDAEDGKWHPTTLTRTGVSTFRAEDKDNPRLRWTVDLEDLKPEEGQFRNIGGIPADRAVGSQWLRTRYEVVRSLNGKWLRATLNSFETRDEAEGYADLIREEMDEVRVIEVAATCTVVA